MFFGHHYTYLFTLGHKTHMNEYPDKRFKLNQQGIAK